MSVAILEEKLEVVNTTKREATDRVQLLESSLVAVMGAITDDLPQVTADAGIQLLTVEDLCRFFNPLPTNDTPMSQGLSIYPTRQ